MKLKGILLSTLVAVALLASTGASANSISFGWTPHGHVNYTITIGHPHVVTPQRWQHRGRQVNHHRQWRPRPVKRHHRGDRRGRVKHHRYNNQRHHNQRTRRHH